MRPSFIGHYTDFLDEDSSSYPGSSELMSIGSAVGKKLGLKKFGIHVEILQPGRRTSYPHAESAEEEFAFVVEGEPHAWINGDLHPLKAGDFVAFPAGTGITHTFINNSQHPVKLLVGGDRALPDNKIIYPLNDETNLVKKTIEQYWEDHPVHKLGSHDGIPDLQKTRPTVKWELPTLETERLILRPMKLEYAKDMLEYLSDDAVTEFSPYPTPKTIAEVETSIKRNLDLCLMGASLYYSLCLKGEPDKVIGDVVAFYVSKPFRVMEFGGGIRQQDWGKGLVPEALKKLMDHCQSTYNLNRMQARCATKNVKSYKMLTKLGMRYEGTIYSSFVCKGQPVDMEMFSITKKGP